jgi:SAM-dependent methyltransferase
VSESNSLRKLNIGCGGKIIPGFINLDKFPHAHVDIIYDLESGEKMHWRGTTLPQMVPDNTFDRMLMSHTFEHIRNILPCMQELWRVAAPGCRLAIITPYGSSDNAWEDPTHVRAVFMDSMMYFSQVWYERNDYGYRGDWHFQRRIFHLNKDFFTDNPSEQQIGYTLQHMRNIVTEFHCELIAVKPMREHPFESTSPETAFKFV